MREKPPKRLLSELLPDPSPPAVAGSPRRRTVQRMQSLLALTAASAGLGACSRTPAGDGQPTSPPDTTATTSSASSTSSASASADTPTQASAVPVLTASVSPRPPKTAYAVVDPLPGPARCTGLTQSIPAKATWKNDSTLVLVLSKPKRADIAYDASQTPDLVPRSCKIKKSKVTAASATFEIEVPPTTDFLKLSVGTLCPTDKQHVVVSVSTSVRPSRQGAVYVSVSGG